MSSREGITGTGAIYYPADPGLLAGRMASEYEPKVYPDDRCPRCEALGRYESEECFTHHWNKGKKE